MTAANLATVMANIATGLGNVSGLRVFAFPPASAQPPFAFVNMPVEIAYDLTMGRGSDQFTLDVYVGVAHDSDRNAAAAMCSYASGTGATSIKTAIEAAVGVGCRVTKATFSTLTLSAGTYAGIVFTVDFGG